MNIILTTLAAGSIIFVGGCNKTKNASANNAIAQPSTTDVVAVSDVGQFEIEYNVEVESDGEQIVLNINGEEQVIDLDNPAQWMHAGTDADSNMEIKVIVNGEDVDGDIHSLPQHIMQSMGDGENIEVEVYMTGDHMGAIPSEIQKHIMQRMHDGERMGGMWVIDSSGGIGERGGHPMMRMMGGEGHDDMMRMMGGGGHDDMMRMMGGGGHEGMMRMHDQMIEMMGDREMPEEMREMHEQMMEMHDMEQRPEHRVEVRRFHDEPDEHEFMQELGMMNEMSYHLSELGAISMLGIHMIRDELEPEARMDALERIIDETPNPSPARNAALIVAIETLRELEMHEEATDMMVELVVSNARWDDHD